MEQEEYDDIFMYLKESKYNDGKNDNDKRMLRRKAKNFVYVLTCMDYTSKWPEAFPIYSKSTAEVGDKLYSTICRFGVMREIESDQGGEFSSKLISYICDTLKIKHITTFPYHPQGNGMVERFNQTLKGMINKTISDHSQDWDKHIKNVYLIKEPPIIIPPNSHHFI
ncbi:unnamed protein product [Mytilus coruscus]|uniref:Integrase catalytic domain-containing protein n=1 Tax=Mytilus coruscus TaxID=42192 RepID=A0A6J8ATQ0_MYTCO|nr:unnamed protein product [Mytilus coruscus]